MIPAPLAGARSLDGLLAVLGWSEGLLRCFLFSRYSFFADSGNAFTEYPGYLYSG